MVVSFCSEAVRLFSSQLVQIRTALIPHTGLPSMVPAGPYGSYDNRGYSSTKCSVVRLSIFTSIFDLI